MTRRRTHGPHRLVALEDRTAPAAWIAQGPGPTLNGQVENIPGPNPVVGAIHTVQAHPTDADILYAGSANGGIWKTTNASAASPTWVNQTDAQPSQSMGALEFDPTDPTHNTLVAGFGRYSSFSGNGAARAGLIRTTDGGTSWTAVNGGVMAGRNISGLAPRGSVIVASVNVADNYIYPNVGIFRSTDGGASYAQVSGAAGTGLPACVSLDLTGDPTDPAVLYMATLFAAGGPNGIYKSTDTGATWTKVSTAAVDAVISDANTSNIELSVGTANNVYVGIINLGQIGGLFRSGNGGSTWTAMDVPRTLDGGLVPLTNATNASPIVITSNGHGLTTGNQVRVTGVTGNTAANGDWSIAVLSGNTFRLNNSTGNGAYAGGGTWQKVSGLQPREKPELAGGQGGLHFSIYADPSNPNIVYIGGDRQDFPFPNSLGATDFTGRLFRGDASIPPAPTAIPSPQWTPLTHSGTPNNSAPHADSRDIDFDAAGNLIEVDDGGIYRRSSPRITAGSWTSLNGSLQGTEFHNIAYDSRSNILIGGAQDTGTPQQQTPGGTVWTSVSTADGGDVAVDTVTLAGAGQSIRYSSFQNLGAFRRRSYGAANNLIGETFISLPGGYAPNFVNPVELNVVTPQRLIVVGSNGVWESLNQGGSWAQVPGLTSGVSGFPQNAAAYGHPGNTNVIWLGSGGRVYRRTVAGGNMAVTTAAFPGTGTVRDLVLGTTADTAFVLDADQVYRTTTGGGAWTDVTGNLLGIGAAELRTIEYIPAAAGDFLVVGTRTGVYRALVSNPTAWTLFGTGLPTVNVWDLEYDATDDVLAAGTLGRGAWLLQGASLSETDVVVNANQFGGNGKDNGTADGFRLAVNGANLEIYINGTLSRAIPLAPIISVIVEGSGDADTLDMTGGLFPVPGGVTFAGAGGTDTLLGPNAAAAWSVTGAGAGTLTAGSSLTFTGLENLTGGTNADAVTFAGGSLTGTIDGGPGSDTIAADDAGRAFTITAANAGTVAATTTAAFANVETLTGGAGADLFQFAGGATLTGAIDAGGGTDTLAADDLARVLFVTGPNAGSIVSVLPGYSDVENLRGGAGIDTFAFGPAGVLTGTIDGGAGTDTLSGTNAGLTFTATGENAGTVGTILTAGFSAVESLSGGSGADTFAFAGGSLTGLLDGGLGTDQIIGDDAGRTYTVSGPNGGSAGGLVPGFVSVETVLGGTGADTLALQAGGSLSGPFDGGAGTDALDLSGLGAQSLAVGDPSGTDGFDLAVPGVAGGTRNMDAVVGSPAADSLTGRAVPSTWTVSGTNAGTYADDDSGRTLGFSAVENLTGGPAADLVRFAGGLLTGQVDGGAAADTLAGDDGARTFTVTGANAGTVSTLLEAGFTGVENLTGGPAADRFLFRGGSLDGTVAGGAGGDLLTGDATGRTFVLKGADAGSVAGLAAFAGVESLRGGTGADSLAVLPGGRTTAGFDGGGGLDTVSLTARREAQAVLLQGATRTGYTLQLAAIGPARGVDAVTASALTIDRLTGSGTAAAWQVRAGAGQTSYRQVSTGYTLRFTGFEQLAGGAGADAFAVDFSAGAPVGTAGISVDGAGGPDTLTVTGTAAADAVSVVAAVVAVNGRAVRQAGIERLTVLGGGGDDQMVVGQGLPSGLADVDLVGGAGADVAQVVPSPTARLRFDGGPGTDRLRADTSQSGGPLVVPPPQVITGTYLFGSRRPIDFVSVERREFGPIL